MLLNRKHVFHVQTYMLALYFSFKKKERERQKAYRENLKREAGNGNQEAVEKMERMRSLARER